MQKKLLWENKNYNLKLYATTLYELETPAVKIPFTDTSRMMMYLQQRYHISDQDYRLVYEAASKYSDQLNKDKSLDTQPYISEDKYTGKTNKWTEQAKKNQEEAKQQIVSMAKEMYNDPELVSEYLQFGARFYKYSPKNVLMILGQNKNATYVQSFEQWKKDGYSVLKGEHGVKVWVPVQAKFLKEGNTYTRLSQASKEQKQAYKEGKIQAEERLVSFRLGNVFDISQTNFPKEKYPEIYNMGFQDASQRMLCNGVAEFCKNRLGYTVNYSKEIKSISLRGTCNRLTREIQLNPLLEDSQRLSTLVHEMGHAMLHRSQSDKTTAQKEFEADAISIMFLSDVGLKPTDARLMHLSDNYHKLVDELQESMPETADLEQIDKSISDIFSPVFKTYQEYVNDFYQDVNKSVEQQKSLSVNLSDQDLKYLNDCTDLLVQDVDQDILNQSQLQDFLQDDLLLNSGNWMNSKLKEYSRSADKDMSSKAGNLLHRFKPKSPGLSVENDIEIGL